MIISPHISITTINSHKALLEVSGAELLQHFKQFYKSYLLTINNEILDLSNQIEEQNINDNTIIKFETQMRNYNKLSWFSRMISTQPSFQQITEQFNNDKKVELISLQSKAEQVKLDLDFFNSFKNPKYFYMSVYINGPLNDDFVYKALCYFK